MNFYVEIGLLMKITQQIFNILVLHSKEYTMRNEKECPEWTIRRCTQVAYKDGTTDEHMS